MLPKIGVNKPCGERFRREKYNIYLTNYGQNAAFWTTMRSWQATEILKIDRFFF
jgi:hypothetical protein